MFDESIKGLKLKTNGIYVDATFERRQGANFLLK
jgi:16S rRNA C1402 N4-methylase RsmH